MGPVIRDSCRSPNEIELLSGGDKTSWLACMYPTALITAAVAGAMAGFGFGYGGLLMIKYSGEDGGVCSPAT